MQRVFLFVYGLVIFAAGSVFAASSVYAQDFDMSLKSTIAVSSLEKKATVTTTITLNNNADSETPINLVIPAYGSDLKAITASYTVGGATVSVKYDSATRTIELDTTRSFKGEGKTWGVRVTYSTNIVEKLGASSIIVVPPSEGLLSDKIALVGEVRELELDLGLGVATRIGATTPESSLSIGRQILSWTEDELIDYATGVIYGSSALVDVELSTTLKNTGFWWTTKTLTLPPDTNQQKVFVENISPLPDNVRVDIDGNILADFRLQPRQTINVTASAKILVNNYTYALSRANGGITELEATTLAGYLASHTDFPVINHKSSEGDSAIDEIKSIINAVRAVDASSFGTDLFAQTAGRNQRFVGTLRKAGIPARVVRGQISVAGQWAPHVWSDVYVSGLGWITIDASADTKSFATTDVRYVGLMIRSADNKSPDSFIPDTTLNYVSGNKLPESAEIPSLSSKTYMFFPWVGLRVTTVSMPVGSVTDGAGLIFENDRTTNLGSLAPYQLIKSRDPLIGSKTTKSAKISYFIAGAEANQEITSITSSVSWLPLFVEGVMTALGGAVFFVWMKRDKFSKGINFNLFRKRPKRQFSDNHKAVDDRIQFSEKITKKEESFETSQPVKVPRVSFMKVMAKKRQQLPDIHGKLPSNEPEAMDSNEFNYRTSEKNEEKPEKDRRKLIQ